MNLTRWILPWCRHPARNCRKSLRLRARRLLPPSQLYTPSPANRATGLHGVGTHTVTSTRPRRGYPQVLTRASSRRAPRISTWLPRRMFVGLPSWAVRPMATPLWLAARFSSVPTMNHRVTSGMLVTAGLSIALTKKPGNFSGNWWCQSLPRARPSTGNTWASARAQRWMVIVFISSATDARSFVLMSRG